MAKKKGKGQATGYCRHCKQQRIIYLPDGFDPEDKTQEEYDDLATEQCDCEQALTESERSQKKEAAIKRMTGYYDEQIKAHSQSSPEAAKERGILEKQQALMIKVVTEVADRAVDAAAVALTKCEMFTVTMKAKGNLQIKRTFKGSEEWIF